MAPAPLLRRRMALRFHRRHLLRLQTLQQLAPTAAVLEQRRHRLINAQVHLCLRPVLAVTGDAIGLEKRLDGAREPTIEVGPANLLSPRSAGEVRRRRESERRASRLIGISIRLQSAICDRKSEMLWTLRPDSYTPIM